VAEGVDELVHIQAAGPVGEHVVARVEVHRRDHGDEVAHLGRVQRAVAQRERAALADAEQVDRVLAVLAAQMIDGAAEEALDVVLQLQITVGAVRIAQSRMYTSWPRSSRPRTIDLSACRSTMYGRLTRA
ncbi:hypothetical protein CATMIT_01672, partial [Catenibacterium mitsuokai DSM 15897]